MGRGALGGRNTHHLPEVFEGELVTGVGGELAREGEGTGSTRSRQSLVDSDEQVECCTSQEVVVALEQSAGGRGGEGGGRAEGRSSALHAMC